MTRRTTVITPTTQTDALYELPSQPFARRVVSACLYAFTQAVIANSQPELKITDVEGNVLFTATAFTTTAFNVPTSTIMWSGNTSDIASSVVLAAATNLSPGGVYYPCILGDETFIPESNLFTVTLFGSLPADTIPNLVLVTEDADEDFMT
jgi:hypothetical protein